jgi:LacI family transcriptional regulator
MIKRRSVTIAEMARLLGVSAATVGNALNGKGQISPGMVEKVRNLARELNYTPNLAARSLRTNVKDAVGVLITGDIVSPWYTQLISHLEEKLSARQQTIMLSLGKNDPDKEMHCLQNFLGSRVSGVIAGPVFGNAEFAPVLEFMENDLPLVLFNCLEDLPANYVAIDLCVGAEIAVEYLVNNNHRRICYFSCPPSEEKYPNSRYTGFMNAVRKYGLHKGEYSILYGNGNRLAGMETMTKLLRQDGREKLPTALFCHNDEVALGALQVIHQAGLKVPEDISLIGFDDINEAALSLPALTTIGGVMDELAGKLVDTLFQPRSRMDSHVKYKVLPRLIERNSVRKIHS